LSFALGCRDPGKSCLGEFRLAVYRDAILSERLDAGVNHPVADTGIFCPRRNQPLKHLFHVSLAVVAHNRLILA
jgi:hypothetical protein